MGQKFGEARRSDLGLQDGPSFYIEDLLLAKEDAWNRARFPKIVRAPEMVWEHTPHGRLKYISHPKLNARVTDIEAYIQEIGTDGRTGKHRHMAEEFMFILEGTGYSLHWDVEVDMSADTFDWKTDANPKRFDWEAGDWVFVPVNTVHQHFNTSSDERVRFISAQASLYKHLGWHDLEQIENAPEWVEAQG